MKLSSTAVFAISFLLLLLLGAGQSAALTNIPNLAGAASSEARFDSVAAKKQKVAKKKKGKKKGKKKRGMKHKDKDFCVWPITC